MGSGKEGGRQKTREMNGIRDGRQNRINLLLGNGCQGSKYSFLRVIFDCCAFSSSCILSSTWIATWCKNR